MSKNQTFGHTFKSQLWTKSFIYRFYFVVRTCFWKKLPVRCKIDDFWKKLNWTFDEPLKVNVLTEAVSPNVIHDKCDSTIFGPSFECKLTEDATEPEMQCIEDCGITKYICDCNVYRYFFYFTVASTERSLSLNVLQSNYMFFVKLIRISK